MNWDWLVGFIEGEGSFSVNHRGEPVFYISQKEKEILDKIQEFLKMGKVYEKRNNPYPHWIYQIWAYEDQKRLAKMIKNRILSFHVKNRFNRWYQALSQKYGQNTKEFKMFLSMKAKNQSRDRDNRLWISNHGMSKSIPT